MGEEWNEGEEKRKREVVFLRMTVRVTVRGKKILLLFLTAAPNLLLVRRILLPHYVFKNVSAPKYTLGCKECDHKAH